jgi:ABC-type protease/lipase transport system fused ATPase/permease subunit
MSGSVTAQILLKLMATGGVYLDGQSTYTHERGSFGEAVGYEPPGAA